MGSQPARSNRGPAAAPENRRAIVSAARRLFAERGYQVPLSAIAREAGVGQGVLYRHFPSRLDLAFTVFEDNLADLETIASDDGPGAFSRLWRRVVDLTVTDAAFVEMAVEARRLRPDYDGEQRLLRMIEPHLEPARAAGEIPQGLTLDDLVLVQRMVYGVVVTAPEEAEARRAVDTVMDLVGLPRGRTADA